MGQSTDSQGLHSKGPEHVRGGLGDSRHKCQVGKEGEGALSRKNFLKRVYLSVMRNHNIRHSYIHEEPLYMYQLYTDIHKLISCI